jgi:hypothetical protein
MKKLISLVITCAILNSTILQTSAGDREWATVGKILTAVAAVSILGVVHEPPPVVVYTQPVIYQPPVVVYTQPVIYQPPVVVYTQPVIYQSPVVVYTQPVIYQPHPVVYMPSQVYCHPVTPRRVYYGTHLNIYTESHSRYVNRLHKDW